MGLEVVYCFKCQKRLSETDFQKGEAFRVGITTTCRKCSAELIAALSPEQQAAFLSGPAQRRATPQAIRTDPSPAHETDRQRRPPDVPTPRHAPTVHGMHSRGGRTPAAFPVAYLVAGAAAVIALLAILLMSGGERPPAPAAPVPPTAAGGPVKAPVPPPPAANPPVSAPAGSSRRLAEAEESLRAAREYAKANPNDAAGGVQRFQRAMWDAEQTTLAMTAKLEYEEALARSKAGPTAPAAPAPPATPEAAQASTLPPPTPKPVVAPTPPVPPPAPASLTAAELEARHQSLRKDHEEAVRKALETFKASMAGTPDDMTRRNAVEQLGKAEIDVRIATELLRHMTADPERWSALYALTPYCGDEKVARAQWTVIQSDPGKLSTNLWALFGCGCTSLVPALTPYLKHANMDVADAAIWLMESMFCAESVDGLLSAWEELEAARKAGGKAKEEAEKRLKKLYWLAPAIARMTGQQFQTPAEYRAWWTKARSSYKPAPAPRPMPVCMQHQVFAIQPGTRLPPGVLVLETWSETRSNGSNMASGTWLKKPPDRAYVIRELESPYRQEEYIVARVRGYLIPPADGDYRFWIAADDRGEFYLSTDDTPAAKSPIAKVTSEFNYARAWDPHPDQASRPIPLKTGRRYYFEAHLVNGKGLNVISVAWQPPGGRREVIPGRFLIPFECSTPDAGSEGTALAKTPAAPPATPPVVAAPPPQGLVGWWRFDESGGETAEDASGNGRTARLVGPVKRVLGKFGRGIQLAGDGGHVELPRSPALDRVQDGSYTLAAWFRPEATPEAPERFAILVKAPPATGIAFNHERRFVAEHWTGGPPPLVIGAWDRECTPGSFHHVIVMVDRQKGQLTFHLDGAQADKRQIPPGAGAPEYAATPWRVGLADPASATRKWSAKGVIDEVRLYDRTLTPDDISALQKSPAGEPAPPPAQVPATSDAAQPQAPRDAPKPAVTKLVLIDGSNRDIRELRNGDTLKLSALPTRKLNIRAVTEPSQVGHVLLELDGIHKQSERVAPYCLFGDNKTGEMPPGSHTITATPFTEKNGGGEPGNALTIRFQVTD